MKTITKISILVVLSTIIILFSNIFTSKVNASGNASYVGRGDGFTTYTQYVNGHVYVIVISSQGSIAISQ
jgi:hypothetical protein